MPPVLVVLDDDGKYKGVIARRWIIRSKLDPSVTKVKTLTRTAPTVTLHDSLGKVAELMIESEIRQLPVYSREKLLGFVTDEDVIHGAVLEKCARMHTSCIEWLLLLQFKNELRPDELTSLQILSRGTGCK